MSLSSMRHVHAHARRHASVIVCSGSVCSSLHHQDIADLEACEEGLARVVSSVSVCCLRGNTCFDLRLSRSRSFEQCLRQRYPEREGVVLPRTAYAFSPLHAAQQWSNAPRVCARRRASALVLHASHASGPSLSLVFSASILEGLQRQQPPVVHGPQCAVLNNHQAALARGSQVSTTTAQVIQSQNRCPGRRWRACNPSRARAVSEHMRLRGRAASPPPSERVCVCPG